MRGNALMVVLERLEKSLGQLSQLAALTLVIPCGRLLLEDQDAGSIISQDIGCATKILESVPCTRLGEVRMEFEQSHLATLGRCLFWGGAPLEMCNVLEDALLSFPLCGIVFHHPVASQRTGRAKFWSPIVRSAFPRLDERRLLTFTRRMHCLISLSELAS